MRTLTVFEIAAVSGGEDQPQNPPSGDQPSTGDTPNPQDGLGAMDTLCNAIDYIPGPLGDYFGGICEGAVELGNAGAKGIDEMKSKSMDPAAEIAESI